MTTLSRQVLACALIGPTTGVTAAESNAERGAQLAAQGDGSGAPCGTCHGADGSGNNAAGFPRLAGLDSAYLAKQILDFNAGERVSR